MPEGTWGKEVKKTLVDRSISMGELAELVGYSREYVSSIVSGRVRCPGAKKKISEYLDIDDTLTN